MLLGENVPHVLSKLLDEILVVNAEEELGQKGSNNVNADE